MAPYPKVTSFPPLGQLSISPPEQEEISFTVMVEWNKARPNYPFEVSLCYTKSTTKEHASRWPSIPLKSSLDTPVILGKHEDAFRSVFVGVLHLKDLQNFVNGNSSQHVSFTFKYRVYSFTPWQWVEVQDGTQPGELLLQKPVDSNLSTLPVLQLQPGWKVSKLDVETRSATVFQLESLKNFPRRNTDTVLEMQVLGEPQDQLRFLAIVRLEPYWLGPRHGKDYFHISEDAIVSSFLSKDGQILTIVALNGANDVYTVLKSNDCGQVVVAARNSGDTEVPFRVLAAVASTFEASLAAAMDEARKIVNQSSKIQILAGRATGALGNSGSKTALVDEWLDGLTYCTWNGIGQSLTEAKILSTLDKLSNNGISISTLLIDDNWQTLGNTDYDFSVSFNRGWSDFEANKEGFPAGLKGLVSQIRQKYPNIQDVGVWHALFGYWAGIAPSGQIAKDYQTARVQASVMGEGACSITSIDSTDLHRLYDDFYSWLSSCGITFVKTDVQYVLGELGTSTERAAFTSTYQSAWTSAYLQHFSGKAISCMSQIPEIMFHSLLQTHTPRILLRNSDDFYPEIPASHPWHLWANAHNSLFTQHLNVIPDWDMFQTSHEYSAYHAAARCLSGGPVLITDTPGEHDASLIGEMTACSPNGRSIVLRTNMGKTTSVFDGYKEGHVLKIGTYTGAAAGNASSTSFLGVFNISDRQITFLLPLSEFPGFSTNVGTSAKSQRVLIHSHTTSDVFGPFDCDLANPGSMPEQLLYATLPVRGYDIFSAHRVLTLSVGSSEISVCVLGLLFKMTGGAAVTGSSISATEDGRVHVKVALKALGTLGIWVSGSRLSNHIVAVEGKPVADNKWKVSAVKQEADSAQIIEIDVLSFWREQELWDSGCKEVSMDIILG